MEVPGEVGCYCESAATQPRSGVKCPTAVRLQQQNRYFTGEDEDTDATRKGKASSWQRFIIRGE